MKGNLKEKFIHIIKVITGQDYKELKAEWEQQNITIDKLTVEKNNKQKEVDKLIIENQLLLKDNEYLRSNFKVAIVKIKKLEKDLKYQKAKNEKELENQKTKYEKELEEKEKSRHSSASKNGAYVVRIKELEAQVEFLKKHRRSPSLDELKDYTLRRKSVCKKK